jgi:Asp-tRNA(Asn)/Glu-tRNA(Gln) amidotransferase A subunit family amidase
MNRMNNPARPKNLYQLSATQIVAGIEEGAFTAEAVLRACLDRIAERDPLILAWVAVDAEKSLEEARRRDRMPSRGPLHGVPFGVKDVIDTAELPTQMGSPLYKDYRARYDASCVALAKAAGAIVLGKTATAEFAGTTPPATRNPLNPEHTPGGSSSGSGAAVADYMVPVAYGTQTGGSTLRPASFCGVIGFKPTFGAYNPVGVKPAAESFDTLGLIARSLDDVALFHAVLVGDTPNPVVLPDAAPRIGVCRTHLWDTAQPETVEAIEDAMRRLEAAGASVTDVAPPAGFDQLTVHRAVINAYERARGLAAEWFTGREGLTPQMIRTCEAGFAVSRADYVNSLGFIERYRIAMGTCFAGIDALLTPAATGEAPRGIEYAGDPRFQELWTLLHVPTITLPTHRGPNGLPVGIQLVTPRYHEPQLFTVARWVEDRLGRA